MIQFNLLPDVKIGYIKARRQKRIVIMIAGILAAAALAIFVMLFVYVRIAQVKHSNDLSADIKTSSENLEGTKDLNKILTVQNQLNSLPDLHNKKAVASRLFGYLAQLTPSTASITQLDINFADATLMVNGEAEGLDIVNQYVDTFKYTKYVTTADQNTEKQAFKDVVLSSFGRSESTTFTISLKFEPAIFDSASEVTLKVPAGTVTRIQEGSNDDLFQPSENQEDE